MRRTGVAVSFVIASALIGAAVAVVLLGADRLETSAPAARDEPVAEPAPPSFVVSDTRVAVRFPARYEFERMTQGEVRFYDPGTKTRVIFHVSRLSDAADFQDKLAALIRKLAFRGQVSDPVYLTDTHAHLTSIEMFRLYAQISVFLGEDCWGKPVLVQALYEYDRTRSDEKFWLDQTHADFPQFEFAYRCPTRD